MLFQLFCTLSVCCQITSTGSGAWCLLHLSGIFPDREKKGAWDSRTGEGLGLNEHFKCWSQVIRQSQWDQQRTVGSKTFCHGWFSADFPGKSVVYTLTGASWAQNRIKMLANWIHAPLWTAVLYSTVDRNKQMLVNRRLPSSDLCTGKAECKSSCKITAELQCRVNQHIHHAQNSCFVNPFSSRVVTYQLFIV